MAKIILHSFLRHGVESLTNIVVADSNDDSILIRFTEFSSKARQKNLVKPRTKTN